MSKKCRFTVPFDKQHGECAQTLFKSSRRHLYHIYRSVRRIFSLKKSLLLIRKILTLFVNTFTADDKYSLLNRDNLTQPIEIQLSQKQKIFSEFFFCSFEIYIKFWTISKKKMTFIADVFPKLRTPKNVIS